MAAGAGHHTTRPLAAKPGRVWLGVKRTSKEAVFDPIARPISSLYKLPSATDLAAAQPRSISMAGKELRRKEAWCLAAGTVLLNALVTTCILAVALPRAGSPGSAGPGDSLMGSGAAASGSHSRKLQQVSGSKDWWMQEGMMLGPN